MEKPVLVIMAAGMSREKTVLGDLFMTGQQL